MLVRVRVSPGAPSSLKLSCIFNFNAYIKISWFDSTLPGKSGSSQMVKAPDKDLSKNSIDNSDTTYNFRGRVGTGRPVTLRG